MQLKRPVSLLLSVCLLAGLTACGKTAAASGGAVPGTAQAAPDSASPAGSAVAMGRWVESEVPVGGDLTANTAPALLDDGTLWQFCTDSARRPHKFISTDDGATWAEEPLDWQAATGGDPGSIAVSGNGTVFFASSTRTDGTTSADVTYWYQPPGGALIPLDFTGLFASIAPYNDINNAFFIDDDTLLLLPCLSRPGGKILSNDTSDQPPVLYTLSTGAFLTVTGMANPGTDLYGAARVKTAGGSMLNYIDYDSGTPRLYQVDNTGRFTALTDTITIPNNAVRGAADSDGNYYYCTDDGVYRMAAGGALGEQLFPLADTGVGGLYILGFTRTAGGDFLLRGMRENGAATPLYRYHWDDALPGTGTGQITVWSLYDSPTVRAAILAYKAGDPNRDVTYEPVFADGPVAAGTAKEDALRTLNTALLAGEGPDVLILDGVDYTPYAGKGLLADLTACVDTGALAENLTAPFITDGRADVLPARFTLPLVIGDPDKLAALSTLDDMQAAVTAGAPRPDIDIMRDGYYTPLPENEQYAFCFMSAEQLLTFLMQTSAPALLRDDTLDTDALNRLYRFAEAVGAKYDIKHYRPADEQVENITTSSGDGDPYTISARTEEYQLSRAQYGWGDMTTPAFCYHTARYSDLDGARTYAPVTAKIRPGLVEGAYLPAVLLAVNANSARPEESAAFAQALFGEAAQTTYSDEGMPVLRTALEASVAHNTPDDNRNGADAFRGDVGALLAACKTPVILSDTLQSALLPHVQKILEGTESPADAATATESTLSLSLSERK